MNRFNYNIFTDLALVLKRNQLNFKRQKNCSLNVVNQTDIFSLACKHTKATNIATRITQHKLANY